MRIAYLDCFAGISGDMLLGALLDAGWPLVRLQALIAALGLERVQVEAVPVTKQHIAGTHLRITIPEEHVHRGRDDLARMVEKAALPPAITAQAIAVIDALAIAESRVHNVPVEQIHFHEVGAVDTIIDIAGSVLGLHELGIEAVYCAPLPWSHGTVKAAHGILPVPPPAVAVLMEGLPVVGADVRGEMITPTGAALARTLSKQFGLLPAMRVHRVSYGAGTREWPDRPNLLRLVIGDTQDTGGLALETLTVLACNLDDMNPQWYGPLMDVLFAAGALDVWLTPIQMKKSRPAAVVEVLCEPSAAAGLRLILLQHTTTLGLRESTVSRYRIERTFTEVETPYGRVRVKIGILPDGERKLAPEHDDCVARAREHNVSVREVWLAAMRAASEA